MRSREHAVKGAKKATRKSAARTVTVGETSTSFTDDERAAMRERAQELKTSSRRGSRRGSRAGDAGDDAAVLAKIASLPEPDRVLGERLHAIIRAAAPSLAPRLWYGMPAYARDGKVVCFFQSAQKFKTRYATLGFSDAARLDDGTMWPVAFALRESTPADEARIRALVTRAAN
jgi:uncharacterized protein YdhG (YjbR/CyaY superfamily)